MNYGFGYGGVGYEGGYWNGGRFNYNTRVNNVNVTNIHNTYVKNVTVNNTVTNNRVSYNGGKGGLQAQARPQELAAQREQHIQPTQLQQTHQQSAAQDRGQLASVNSGRPQMAAARTPGEYQTAAQQHAAAQPITPGDRAANQQQRIGQGVRSGQLNARQTSNLEDRSASIHQQANADRAANGGRLNQQQRQNNVSQSIARDRNNGADRQQARPEPRNEGGHPH